MKEKSRKFKKNIEGKLEVDITLEESRVQQFTRLEVENIIAEKQKEIKYWQSFLTKADELEVQ